LLSIYLAGKIQGMDNWHEWREKAEDAILKMGHKPLCPECDTENSKLLYPGSKDWAKQIVQNDFNLVRKADVLLVEARESSDGTAMEVFLASQLGITIIVFGMERQSAFMRNFGTLFFADLDRALEYMEANV
jgi:nucleoside 2-deoxyribosyltransferase